MYLWVSNTSHPKRVGVPALPNFLSSLLYLCLHHLMQNNQIQHGNTKMEQGLVFRWSVMSSIPRRYFPNKPNFAGSLLLLIYAV